jgi:hypothetical protein
MKANGIVSKLSKMHVPFGFGIGTYVRAAEKALQLKGKATLVMSDDANIDQLLTRLRERHNTFRVVSRGTISTSENPHVKIGSMFVVIESTQDHS